MEEEVYGAVKYGGESEVENCFACLSQPIDTPEYCRFFPKFSRLFFRKRGKKNKIQTIGLN